MKHYLLKSSALISSLTALSRLLGFFRDIFLAYFLGATIALDAFIVVLNLPNLLKRVYAEGAISQTIIPSMAQGHNSREEDAYCLSLLVGSLSFVLFIFVALLIIFSPFFISVLAPGFPRVGDKFALSTTLLRAIAPYMGFIMLAGVYSAFLNKKHIFGTPAAVPMLLNLMLIIILLLGGYHTSVVYWLVIGVSFSGLLQMSLLARLTYNHIAWRRPKIRLNAPIVQRVLFGLLPTITVVSVIYIGFFVDILFASSLATGNISWLYYSERLVVLPISLIGGAIAVALLPRIISSNKVVNKQQMQKALGAVFLLGIPAALGLYFLSQSIVAALFYRGAFGIQDVLMVQRCISAFALGIPAFLAIKIIAVDYFARGKIKYPFICACIAISVNILLNLICVKSLGHIGLALATSLAGWLNFLLLYGHYVRKIASPTISEKIGLLKCLVANVLFAAYLYLFNKEVLANSLLWSSSQRFLYLVLSVCAAMCVYGVLLKLTRINCHLRLENRI